MSHEAYFYSPSSEGIHWITLRPDGALQHSLHRLAEQPEYQIRRFSSPVKQFSSLLLRGCLHLLMASKSGIYYAQCGLGTAEKREMCISRNPRSAHPYLFSFGDAIYLGHAAILNGTLSYVLKRQGKGGSTERVYPFVREDGELHVHIEQACYDVSELGVLYGLFLIRYSDTDKQQLVLLELDIEAEEPNWVPIFSSARPKQYWTMTVSAARDGRPHLVWVVHNGMAATSYYASGSQSANSCIPLKVSFDKHPAIPQLIVGFDDSLFLCIAGHSQLVCAYSSNGGRGWSPFMSIPFARESRLRIVQGIRSFDVGLFPAPMIGIGFPYFRPIELFDLFHPFSMMKGLPFSERDDMLLQYAQLQLDQIHSFLSERIISLQEETFSLEACNCRKSTSSNA